MRSFSRRPWLSNKQSSTFSAFAENSAKLVPRPSHVAPSGCGAPAEIRTLSLRNEKNCRKWRNNKADLGNWALVQRRDRARVPDIAAAVQRGIAVEDLAPGPRKWNLDAVVAIDLRREVYHHEATVLRLASFTQPREYAAFGVMHDQPLEPGVLTIEFVQSRYRAVKTIEITDQSLHARVPGVLEKMPIKRMIVAPFVLLAELAAHEQELLAGVTEHEAVISAQVGEALPLIARHAPENRTLAVHNLVMGERQDEVLEKRVVQAEKDLAVMMLAVDRIFADVFERVVHPSHVPLVAEPETAPIHRPRYHRPGGRLLRRRGRIGKSREQLRIEAAKQIDGVEVFASAVFVRHPAAFGPAVIEIQHGSDGIHAQPVDAVAIEPEQSAGRQEVCDFGAPTVVDERVPIEVASLLWIFMLVECRPVETAEAMGIVGEVSRYPVNDDAQALLVACIDQGGKVGWSAEATGGRKKSGRLIAPGSVERMFTDRQEFDMREPHVARVSRQFLRQLAVAQPTAAMLRMSPPRPEMDFIDRYRRTQGIDAARCRLRPLDRLAIDHDRSCSRSQLGSEGQWVGLQREQMAVRADDLIFIFVAGSGFGHKNFPKAIAAHAHGVAASIP